jgi:hypothetical protein
MHIGRPLQVIEAFRKGFMFWAPTAGSSHHKAAVREVHAKKVRLMVSPKCLSVWLIRVAG